MYNALKLDWLTLKGNKKNMAFQIVCIQLFGMFIPVMFIPYLCLIVFMLCLNIFAIEEKSQLENLYFSLPIERKSVVQARYVFSFITFVTLMILGIIGYVISLHFNNIFKLNFEIGLMGILFMISIMYLGYSMIISCFLPILFKYGVTKSRKVYIFLMAGTFGILGLGGGLMSGIEEKGWIIEVYNWLDSNSILIFALLFVIGTSALYVSYEISVKIYNKKDF
ncbi:MAG: ABC-2 transporter permease [Ruminococcus sp.]|jgi:ABC-type transport system involved in multi-copper enzyme maturation permease subunit|nr:ABC-2 transporter permease [Ruminococcus sp.]